MSSQTTSGDSDDTVATKKYVDTNIGGGPSGSTWFDFGNMGVYLEEGSSVSFDGAFPSIGSGQAEARVNGGIIQTRTGANGVDCGWKDGNTSYCCGGSLKITVTAFASGIKIRADYWHGDCDTGWSSFPGAGFCPWGFPGACNWACWGCDGN